MAKQYYIRKTDDQTIDPTLVPATNTGTVLQTLSRLANRIKAITGKSSWVDWPTVTLEDAATHHGRTDNPHSATAAQTGALVSVDGVSNAGGNVDFVAGTGTTITPNDAGNTVTFASSGIASVDGVSNAGGNVDFVAGTGMTITPDDTANTVTFVSSGGGSSQPFPDNTALVKNNTDNTKLVRMDVTAVAAATTRVLTMPNSDVTLANVPAIASQAQADTGTDDATIMTPLKVASRPQKNVVFETFIHGLNLTWNTPGTNGTNLTVTPGAAWIPSLGRIYNVSSTITGPSMTFSASTWYYVYLYDSSGTPTLDISTTAPATGYKDSARAKTSDTSRRFLGQFLTDSAGSPAMLPFVHNAGNEIYYTSGSAAGAAPYRVMSGVAPNLSNQTQSLAGIAPPAVTQSVLADLIVQAGATLGLATLEIKLTSGMRVAMVGVTMGGGGGGNFYCPVWTPVNSATPSFLYSTSNLTGATFYLDVFGYKFAR